MLITDPHAIGNKLYKMRKDKGLSQAEAAELAGISDRTYADIERGSINPRIETILSICAALRVTPDAILTEKDPPASEREAEILARLAACPPGQKETALQLLSVYLDSIHR